MGGWGREMKQEGMGRETNHETARLTKRTEGGWEVGERVGIGWLGCGHWGGYVLLSAVKCISLKIHRHVPWGK